ncbi:MAG: hypothetical protein MJZ98_03710 [Paludibacteraceae bacterium]|nr:hypothetical protein [Paludibacteraceae bacterium]
MAEQYKNTYRIPTARANWHGYDGGVYFVTICTQNREHYFGDITHVVTPCRDVARRVSMMNTEPQMQLSPIGQYSHEQFVNVKTHYPYAEIPLFVVMPNHIHAIVIIDGENVPYERCNAEHHYGNQKSNADNCRDAARHVSTGRQNNEMVRISNLQGWLSVVVGGIKSSITRYANEKNITFAWQSRFYDRIVRDQNELNRIAEYVENNVANWQIDELNKTI